MVSAPGLWIASWSPDSRLLAYRTVTAEDNNLNPYEGTSVLPYGTFHLLDVCSGSACEYPKDNPYGLQFNIWHAWLPDSRLMTLDRARKPVVLAEACDGGSATPLVPPDRPPCFITNPDSNKSCSPDSQHIGETVESGPAYTTTVYHVVTGRVEAVITWVYSDTGIGHIGGPQWLDNQRIIIGATDSGPLLVTLGAKTEVVSISPTFFNLPASSTQRAAASLVPGTADFHLLMAVRTHWLLYHSESGLVEALEGETGWLSPDGGYVELFAANGNPAWLRAVDPPESKPVQFLGSEDANWAASWSADWSRLGVGLKPGSDGQAVLRAYAMPGKGLLNEWRLGRFSIAGPAWSPDNQFVAIVGYPPSASDQALFIMKVEK